MSLEKRWALRRFGGVGRVSIEVRVLSLRSRSLVINRVQVRRHQHGAPERSLAGAPGDASGGGTVMRPACAWDQTEIVLKASIEDRDQPLAAGWVQAYIGAMGCFPRLHVLADSLSTTVARTFEPVPNSTLHVLEYPAPMRAAGVGMPGRQQPLIHGLPASYYSIQWPFMWADNWTRAEHILVLDTDTWPMLPLRCHHLFDTEERPVWHTWQWPKPPAWTAHVNAMLPRSAQSPRDFMTFFPVVIPRKVLPTARATVERAHGVHFDAAWLKVRNPSYADIIGKVATSSHPDALRVVHCPALGEINQPIPERLWRDQQGNNSCLNFVPVTEHLKHPQRDCHTGSCHHLSRAAAVQYGRQLRRHAVQFAKGRAFLPWQLFHYQFNRSEAELRRIGDWLLEADSPGRVCGARQPALADSASGRPSRRRTSRRSHAAPTPLELLLYDNRFAGRGKPFKDTDVLYRSATELGVPFRVGSLVPASVRGWQSGDREEWLLQTLPKVASQMVVLLDASDALLVCRSAELLQKLRKLLGTDGLVEGRERVVVGAEQQLWPEDLHVHTPRTRMPQGDGAPSTAKRRYPSPPMGGTRPLDSFSLRRPVPPQLGTPFLHINIGLLAGPPSTVLSLFQCMKRRYAGFPRQCPNVRFLNGSYEFVSDAPHQTRFGPLHGAEHVPPHMHLHMRCDALVAPTASRCTAAVTLATIARTQPAHHSPSPGRSLGLGAGMLPCVLARAGAVREH